MYLALFYILISYSCLGLEMYSLHNVDMYSLLTLLCSFRAVRSQPRFES